MQFPEMQRIVKEIANIFRQFICLKIELFSDNNKLGELS